MKRRLTSVEEFFKDDLDTPRPSRSAGFILRPAPC